MKVKEINRNYTTVSTGFRPDKVFSRTQGFPDQFFATFFPKMSRRRVYGRNGLCSSG